MSIIEQLDPVSFSNYLKKYHNTICGRHPIGVLLNVSILRKPCFFFLKKTFNLTMFQNILTDTICNSSLALVLGICSQFSF